MIKYSIIAFCAFAVGAFGQILVDQTPIEPLISESSAICVCSLSSENQHGGVYLRQASGTRYALQILQAYKGLQTADAISAKSGDHSFTLVPGIHYLLFLQSSAKTSQLSIIDAVPVPGAFPILARSDSRSLEDDINTYLNEPKENIEAGLGLIGRYQSLSQKSQATLNRLSSSPDDRVALLSDAILLKRNLDSDVIFPRYLARLESTPPSKYPDLGDIDFVFTTYATQLGTASFERLADSERLDVKHASLRALRKLADPKTTSFLIQQLDAPDPDSQYLALVALAGIYHKGGDFGPGLGAFELNREKYIHLWKEWYRLSNGHSS